MATVQSLIESRTTRAAVVLPLCAAIALIDGFDTQAIGPAAPLIARSLMLTPGSVGTMFSASQAGFLIGSILFGMLGDRLGRKRVLVLTGMLFAAATLATALAGSLSALIACRAAAGIGLGGATPNFVSLAAEFSKPERRARVITMLWAAVPFGGMLGSFASARLIPNLGWQSVFVLGAALPVPVIALILSAMPESAETKRGTPTKVGELFKADMISATLLLWLCSLMVWTSLVVSALWMPSLLQGAGWSTPAAATMLAASNAGGVLGTLGAGVLIGRFAPARALAILLACAVLFDLVLGAAVSSPLLFAAAALAAGVCSSAAAGALLATSSGLYAKELRSTGVGWALGVGRTGTVVGPIGVGLLVQAGHGAPIVFFLIGLLALLGAAAAHQLNGRHAHH